MSRPGYVDKRGNNLARARRRAWLLATFDVELGSERARCRLKLSAFCHVEVTIETLSVDRIEMGGSYRRGNIQPACKPCQDRQGGLAGIATAEALLTEYRYARELWENDFERVTGYTYERGLIERERIKERRGGRREVTDFVDENPPPMYADWLREWHASRRAPCEDRSGDAYGERSA